jgi:hypothetical protein
MAVALLLTSGTAKPAETIIGPITHICRDVTADKERANLTLMWVTGYVSGINNLQKPDMLLGLDIGAVIDKFSDVCLEHPGWTVLEAARSTVARLRIDYAKKHQNDK